MNYAKHSNLEGRHALLSPSGYHWLNYSEDKLVEIYTNLKAKEKGTELHETAAKLISLGIKLPAEEKTLNMYVNDAIGYKMMPELPLYYSEYCFGTADALIFRKGTLRIHDLKTGKTEAHMQQLHIYAALFCLEYDVKPSDIEVETRIYQYNKILVDNPSVDIIIPIMDKIVTFDKILKSLQEEE